MEMRAVGIKEPRNRVLWVVEMLMDNGRYESTAGVGLTRKDGRCELAKWRENMPKQKLRMIKYTPAVIR